MPETIADGRRCHRCGAPLTNSGRRSASGLYWCRKSKCQAAKAKYNYDLTVAGHDQAGLMAPTTCSGCGDDMAPRKVRTSDSPLGRWCHKPSCRRKRIATLQTPMAGANVGELQELVTTLSRALVWGREECLDCGRGDAVRGYPHPDLDGGKCYATGRTPLKMAAAQALWPNELGAPDCASVEEYGRLAEDD